MPRNLELQYFFDPLCGWCYASAPSLAGLAAKYPNELRMLPSGLFFGSRSISSIADHAWRNDQRIAGLTGQSFSQAYHQQVLLAPQGVFSSAAATLALQALGEINAELEPRFLHQVQIARYVDGRDTSEALEAAKVAVQVAGESNIPLSVDELAERLQSDIGLRERTVTRMEASQRRMQRLGIQGVPQLVAVIDGQPTPISSEDLYHGPDRLPPAIDDLIAAS